MRKISISEKGNDNQTNNVKPSSSHSIKQKQEIQALNNQQIGSKATPQEVLGFNNQFYPEEHVDFDPERFKKPDPNYGFIHDKYIISSDDALRKMNKDQLKKNMDMIKTTDDKVKSLKKHLNFSSNLSNDQTNASSFKQSYAQKLDKFIGTM